MPIIKIQLNNFRNFTDLFLNLPPEGALFFGDNGSGKTNILEAMYMICTGRSHRGALKNEMIKFGAITTAIDSEFLSLEQGHKGSVRVITFDIDNNVLMRENNQKINSLSEWFGPHPIVSFATSDIQLVYGTPDTRRRFLDFFISSLDREYLFSLIHYKKNLMLRNKILKTSGDEILCNIYEEKMVEYGSTITAKRRVLVHELSQFCKNNYHEIGRSDGDFVLTYKPSFCDNYSGEKSWKNVFYTMLSERRKTDMECGFSSVGPHRDDIAFFIKNKQAKVFASQGQCRSLVLSLKISALHCLEKHTQGKIIVLFDDAVSELDPDRAARVYSLIEKKGQLFIASPYREESLKSTIEHFHVAAGTVTAV